MRPFWTDHPWRLRAVALALAVLLVGLLQAVGGSAVSSIEELAGDLSWRMVASPQPERRVVVVDIDEASLKQLGPWPWPRATIARLSERLDAAGVAVQAFDVVIDAPRDDDALVASAWSDGAVVAGQIFSIDPATRPRVGEVTGALAAAGCPPFAPVSQGYVANSPSVLSAGLSVGHLTPRFESDGVVRKIPALVCHEGRAYASLALAALWRAAQPARDGQTAPDWVWTTQPGRGLAPPAQLTSTSLPGVTVPLDAAGDMRVPYVVARTALASVPAYKVVDGSADKSLLAGAVVLVGATAFGIGDVTATPLSSIASGVEVHAQAVAGLLDHSVPFTPANASGIQAAAGLVAAAILLGIAARRRGAPVKRLPIAGFALAIASYALASLALARWNLWLPWIAPALFALVASTALATAEHALTRAQRERLSAHLGAYLPGPVAERLMATDPSGSIQVDQRHVSVLVADIRNFSAFAAHRPAQETAALLHAFYCIAVDVVEQHGGVVENVVGDSVLAVWNAYSPCPDHAAQALAAAKELLRATRPLLARSKDAPIDHQVQPLALGVGIEAGPAIVGSFGPARRRARAALGEPVSVASRLQQMTQDLSIPVLVGPRLAASVPPSETEPLGDYLLEGMSLQYTLFAPADWADLVPSDQLWADASSASPLGADLTERWSELGPGGPTPAFARSPQRDV